MINYVTSCIDAFVVEAYIEVFKHTRILQARPGQNESGGRQVNIFWPGLHLIAAWPGKVIRLGQDGKKGSSRECPLKNVLEKMSPGFCP